MPFPTALVIQPAAAVLSIAAKAATGPLARKLAQRATRKAYERALHTAATEVDRNHPGWVSALFDESFFEAEAAPLLAQLLVRDGRPNPSELAACWVRSLNAHEPGATRRVREVEPVAASFLESLASELKHEEVFDGLNDSRALDQLAELVSDIATRAGAARATLGTTIDYANWIVARNLYMDSRGTLQTQRQVQLRLDDIYIALRAQRDEAATLIDRKIIDQELSQLGTGTLSGDEREELRETLVARRVGSAKSSEEAAVQLPPTEVAEAVKKNPCIVILGDPGSGKSTVLRYLALRAAQTSLDNVFATDVGPALPALPIFIRIADYAENETWRRQSFTDFVTDYHRVHECPAEGLTDLFSTTLQAGRCLILLDGLDEIVRADDRFGIVQRIEDFVLRHREAGNRFVVTSRRAGYRNAPLQVPFVHYTIQDMSEEEIRRFVEQWCRAVESSETPDLPVEERERVAKREIDGIMSAIATPGVRRLAANPLMLRILALIHRAGASLPQKRIELYKLAADTLARTWRLAQGVPESALVKEER